MGDLLEDQVKEFRNKLKSLPDKEKFFFNNEIFI